MLMGDTTADWRTHVRHVVDVIFQHIDKVNVPQWVQVAVEHLYHDKLTVPAELAATFPLINESQNLDGFDSVVGSDKQELYRLNREALLQFGCLRVSWVWHALHEISPASCPTKLDLSGNLPRLASVETICEDTSSRAVFWSGLWNLVTTTDWTTNDFSTTLDNTSQSQQAGKVACPAFSCRIASSKEFRGSTASNTEFRCRSHHSHEFAYSA